jgi:hypothetical protein
MYTARFVQIFCMPIDVIYVDTLYTILHAKPPENFYHRKEKMINFTKPCKVWESDINVVDIRRNRLKGKALD